MSPLLGALGDSSEYAYRGTLDDVPTDFKANSNKSIKPLSHSESQKQIELQRADGTLFGGPGAKSKKPGGGGSRNKRRTRRHRLKKRMSKRSLTSRNNRRLRKRSHTRRRR